MKVFSANYTYQYNPVRQRYDRRGAHFRWTDLETRKSILYTFTDPRELTFWNMLNKARTLKRYI